MGTGRLSTLSRLSTNQVALCLPAIIPLTASNTRPTSSWCARHTCQAQNGWQAVLQLHLLQVGHGQVFGAVAKAQKERCIEQAAVGKGLLQNDLATLRVWKVSRSTSMQIKSYLAPCRLLITLRRTSAAG